MANQLHQPSQKIGRNAPCPCGSGKKYKNCCLGKRSEVADAITTLAAKQQLLAAQDQRLRDEFGVFINYVHPVEFRGQKLWALGSRVYCNRPANETFHEFLLHILRNTLGEQWRADQAALPEQDRHFLMKCFDAYEQWATALRTNENRHGEFLWSAVPSGMVRYLLSTAWDVASLIHASKLPDKAVGRLRSSNEFQGVRYELAVAAIFARLDCEIRFLDSDPSLGDGKRGEFTATHRPTGELFMIEAKSRHREGVLNQPGEFNDGDPLHGDPRAIPQLLNRALEKADGKTPLLIFIDVNAPVEPDVLPLQKRWHQSLQAWMERLPAPSSSQPDDYNGLFVTNFSPHFDGKKVANSGEWVSVVPPYTTTPATFDLAGALVTALNTYGNVPAIEKDGLIAD